MREVSFGQYYPTNSFVHKCDARLKIVFLIAYIVAVFLAKNFYALGACALVFLIMASCSGVPIKSLLRSVKAVLSLNALRTLDALRSLGTLGAYHLAQIKSRHSSILLSVRCQGRDALRR